MTNHFKQKSMSTIIGRITRDAEIRTIASDKQVVNFSVAINESYKDKQGERKELTTYYNCSYWMNSKIAEFLTKGTLVELSGRVSSNAWIDQSGELKSGLNFHTSKIKLHGSSPKRTETIKVTTHGENNSIAEQETEDDLPF